MQSERELQESAETDRGARTDAADSLRGENQSPLSINQTNVELPKLGPSPADNARPANQTVLVINEVSNRGASLTRRRKSRNDSY